MARRSARARGDLHEGPGFTGTRVEGVYVLSLGMQLGRRIGDDRIDALEMPEDAGASLRRAGKWPCLTTDAR
jgi:hypothetical protein